MIICYFQGVIWKNRIIIICLTQFKLAEYYQNRQVYFGCCHIQHYTQTIHLTENLKSMTLLQMSCVITWAKSFLTSKVVEAVIRQKHHIYINSHFGILTQHLIHPTVPFLLTIRDPNVHQKMRSVIAFSVQLCMKISTTEESVLIVTLFRLESIALSLR